MLQRLDLAFSRDQSERFYVQHVLTAHAGIVREWMHRNAAILVCGSLEGMAPGVDSALRQVLGEPEFQRAASEGRYRRDVY
jgi:sulfite reductase (NADPH) flavoprotein alpha-component